MNLDIYTDGACSQGVDTTQAGGWGVYIEYGNKIFKFNGGSLDTTNNIMELTALFEGLKFAKKFREPYDKINIYIDSAYTMNCFTQKWYEKWRSNGWKTATKQPVKNKELWESILELYESFDAGKINFIKVKGHYNNLGNSIADTLAVEARIEYNREALEK